MMQNTNVPQGWNIKKLDSIATIQRGRFSVRPRNDPAYYGGDTPFVQTGDISQSEIFLKKYSQSLNDKGVAVSKVFSKNTILITIAANIGDTAITTFPVACPDSLIGINNKSCDVFWLNYFLQTQKNKLNGLATQNAQKNINLETLNNLKILVPPIEEQKKIAEILGTWERAIEELTDLIAEKKELKRGLMQRLLTGTQRLPGFYDDWEHEMLGNMVNISSAGSKSQYIEESGRYLIVDMGAVSNEARIIAKKQTNYTHDFLSCGDIVMPKDDIGGGNIIGKTVVIDADNKYILGDHVFKLCIKNTYEAKFISNLINSFLVNKYMRRMATGSAQLGLAKRDVEKCVLWLPVGPAEQKAIADVLSKADSEIELLNQQLDLLKEQKRGLMQKLLTGEIRVKVDVE